MFFVCLSFTSPDIRQETWESSWLLWYSWTYSFNLCSSIWIGLHRLDAQHSCVPRWQQTRLDFKADVEDFELRWSFYSAQMRPNWSNDCFVWWLLHCFSQSSPAMSKPGLCECHGWYAEDCPSSCCTSFTGRMFFVAGFFYGKISTLPTFTQASNCRKVSPIGMSKIER